MPKLPAPRFRLFVALEDALRLNVDLGSGQLGGQTNVLPLLADGKRELIVRHQGANVGNSRVATGLRVALADDVGTRDLGR